MKQLVTVELQVFLTYEVAPDDPLPFDYDRKLVVRSGLEQLLHKALDLQPKAGTHCVKADVLLRNAGSKEYA